MLSHSPISTLKQVEEKEDFTLISLSTVDSRIQDVEDASMEIRTERCQLSYHNLVRLPHPCFFSL
jgi:hypothetical protein